MAYFYELADAFNRKMLRLTVKGDSDMLTSDYSLLFRGLNYPKKTIPLSGYMGGQEADFLWTGSVFIQVISSKVRTLLLESQITGWKTYPVKVHDRKGIELPGYFGFSVIGKECRRDRSRSQIITKQAVPNGESFEVYKGLYFFESDWDGSDIFLVQHNTVVVTERVRNIFVKNKIRNVSLVPLSEVEIDVYLDKFEKET